MDGKRTDSGTTDLAGTALPMARRGNAGDMRIVDNPVRRDVCCPVAHSCRPVAGCSP